MRASIAGIVILLFAGPVLAQEPKAPAPPTHRQVVARIEAHAKKHPEKVKEWWGRHNRKKARK